MEREPQAKEEGQPLEAEKHLQATETASKKQWPQPHFHMEINSANNPMSLEMDSSPEPQEQNTALLTPEL